MRHEVRVAVTMNMAAFWHVMLCSLLENYWCFRGLYRHHLTVVAPDFYGPSRIFNHTAWPYNPQDCNI